ncbi:hypothetical protein RM53_08420 [Brevundimonas nasdae]|uniref:Uncharacterized protein n=1 Tax=Brevundimonas nasdae TaxID=172043 RepID=A0A0B4CPN2_9CAUL|nr:hypothetical protein RM53_08420 [Brevundimonas nasdae]
MAPSPTKLAEALERLTAAGHATVTEREDDVTASGVGAADAAVIAEAAAELGWDLQVEDATPEAISVDQIAPAFEPFRLVVTKPASPPGVTLALSRSSVRDWLRTEARSPVLWAAGLSSSIDTRTARITHWGDERVFAPSPTGCDPRKVVRELAPERLVAGDIDHWLLRDPNTHPPLDHWAARAWADAAYSVLLRALSDEVEENGDLLFRGPPLSRLSPEPNLPDALGMQGRCAVQRAAAWVFETPSEMRPRHDLFAPEIARTAHPGSGAGAAFGLAAGLALEGATVARAFGLSEVSRDSLKAMTDLKKAVGDEIGKLSETTRGIAAAVAAALFAGVALIATRLMLDDPALIVRQAAAVIGAVLFLYVVAVIASGVQYVTLQRRLRTEWYGKIYRFLSKDEYHTMVVKPAASAELGFFLAAWIGGFASLLLLGLVIHTAFADREAPTIARPTAPPAAAAAPAETTTPAAPEKTAVTVPVTNSAGKRS